MYKGRQMYTVQIHRKRFMHFCILDCLNVKGLFCFIFHQLSFNDKQNKSIFTKITQSFPLVGAGSQFCQTYFSSSITMRIIFYEIWKF